MLYSGPTGHAYTQTDRHTPRQTDRHTPRQTDRQTGTHNRLDHTQRHTDIERERGSKASMRSQVDRQTDREEAQITQR